MTRTRAVQRFVSSFTAAYFSVKNRRMFLDALLHHDEDAIKRLAEKIFQEEDFEEDEDDVINTMKQMVEQARPLVIEEIDVLKSLETDLSPA